jgi:hypothetical protein
MDDAAQAERQLLQRDIRELAARFRRIASHSNGRREMQSAYAWGGKLLARATRSGVISVALPVFSTAGNPFSDDSEAYASFWLEAVIGLSYYLREFFPSNPLAVDWTAVDEEGAGVDPANWRIVAENMAVTCDSLVRLCVGLPAGDESEKPNWQEDSGRLVLGDIVVRKIGKQARNLRAILAAFEEAGWPNSISSPIADNTAAHHNTIWQLNEKQGLIRFISTLQGTGIGWQREQPR